ncbi:transcription elongation factor Elf1 like-domain-containing protein [Podospora australis]|uniref:Transcription elongation factor 1 homolog n=1 Tax=Podospora australis TaxID=1536484 RepID=A0AAN6X377_9PEZI|nr:transcription elongation factor Elf1 like-domain-containing protein [Podospora australis]
MGKRKKATRKPTGPKRNEPLPNTFTCLFCNHEKSVSVKLVKKDGVGTLNCKVCGQTFQCGINYLSAAVDVYNAVAQEAAAQSQSTAKPYSRVGASSRRVEEDDIDDDQYGGDGIADDDDYE